MFQNLKRHRGRPRKYVDFEEAKDARKKQNRERARCRISLSSAYTRWRACTKQRGLSDEEFAHLLLDMYEAAGPDSHKEDAISSSDSFLQLDQRPNTQHEAAGRSLNVSKNDSNSTTLTDASEKKPENFQEDDIAETFVPKQEPGSEQSKEDSSYLRKSTINYDCYRADIDSDTSRGVEEESLASQETNDNKTEISFASMSTSLVPRYKENLIYPSMKNSSARGTETLKEPSTKTDQHAAFDLDSKVNSCRGEIFTGTWCNSLPFAQKGHEHDFQPNISSYPSLKETIDKTQETKATVPLLLLATTTPGSPLGMLHATVKERPTSYGVEGLPSTVTDPYSGPSVPKTKPLGCVYDAESKNLETKSCNQNQVFSSAEFRRPVPVMMPLLTNPMMNRTNIMCCTRVESVNNSGLLFPPNQRNLYYKIHDFQSSQQQESNPSEMSRVNNITTNLEYMTGKIQSIENPTVGLANSLGYANSNLISSYGQLSFGFREGEKVFTQTPLRQLKACDSDFGQLKPADWSANLQMTRASSFTSVPTELSAPPTISVELRDVSCPIILSGKTSQPQSLNADGVTHDVLKANPSLVRVNKRKLNNTKDPYMIDHDYSAKTLKKKSPHQELVVILKSKKQRSKVKEVKASVGNHDRAMYTDVKDTLDEPNEIEKEDCDNNNVPDDIAIESSSSSLDGDSSEEDAAEKLDPKDVDFLESAEFRMAVEDGLVRLKKDDTGQSKRRRTRSIRTRSSTKGETELSEDKLEETSVCKENAGQNVYKLEEGSNTCSPEKYFTVGSGSDFDLVYSDEESCEAGTEEEFEEDEVEKKENGTFFVSRAYKHWIPHPQDYTGYRRNDHVFPCPRCKKTFRGLHNWRNHFRYRHLDDSQKLTKAFCNFCQIEMCPYEEKFHQLCAASVCKVQGCGKLLTTRQEYRSHRHDPNRKRYFEPPAQCEECGKKFRNRKTLDVHKRIHTGVKPYVCFHCGAAYPQKASWNYHMQKHHPEDQDWRSHKLIFNRPYKTPIRK